MKRPFGRGITRSLGDLLIMVINHLVTGMILQVDIQANTSWGEGCFVDMFFGCPNPYVHLRRWHLMSRNSRASGCQSYRSVGFRDLFVWFCLFCPPPKKMEEKWSNLFKNRFSGQMRSWCQHDLGLPSLKKVVFWKGYVAHIGLEADDWVPRMKNRAVTKRIGYLL